MSNDKENNRYTIDNLIEKRFPNQLESIQTSFDFNLIESFQEFLLEKNEEGGFFSKKDSALILERHLLESIYFVHTLLEKRYVSREKSIVDIGTGPGLPGFLFACLKESPKLTLLDGSRRKLGLLEKWWSDIFTREANESWKEKRIEFAYARVEECEGTFDLATMRATIPYPFSVETICLIIKKNGYFCPFLGKELNWKNKEKEILSESGFIIEAEIELQELKFLGDRKFKVLKKKASPKHGIPRDWKYISRDIKGAEWVK